MDRDNKEVNGQGTLLHIIKRDPNAWVSSLKESMEPTLRPSNNLIATGPKLDSNILHIKVLFLEYTAILWLKWLTLFYHCTWWMWAEWTAEEVSLPQSSAWQVTWKFGWMLYLWRRFLSLPRTNFCFCTYDDNPYHMRKTCWDESLTCVYSCRPLHHQKRSQNWMELIFVTHGASFSSGNQFPSAWLWYFSPGRDGYHLENGSCWYG